MPIANSILRPPCGRVRRMSYGCGLLVRQHACVCKRFMCAVYHRQPLRGESTVLGFGVSPKMCLLRRVPVACPALLRRRVCGVRPWIGGMPLDACSSCKLHLGRELHGRSALHHMRPHIRTMRFAVSRGQGLRHACRHCLPGLLRANIDRPPNRIADMGGGALEPSFCHLRSPCLARPQPCPHSNGGTGAGAWRATV